MKHQIEETQDRERGGIPKQALMVFVPLIVILLIIIFCIIKVIIWNNGTEYHYEGQGDLSELESESEDYFVAMEKALVEGREDDGLDILFLGDDLLSYGDSSTSIPNQVAAATGARVYNCAFPGSAMACRYAEFNEEYCSDVFSFIRLATCIYANDFTLVDYYKDFADIYDSSFDSAIETLKSIDFNDIDIIFLCYGTYDYLNGYKTTDVANPTAVDAMTGALTLGVNVIHELYPHIRFVVMSPAFCYYDEGDGTLTQGDIRRVGETDATLGGYVIALKAICVEDNISFLDNYFGIPLNAETAQQYMVDAVHVNDECRTLIANKVIDFVKYRLYWQ